MRWLTNMSEAIKSGIKTWLRIQPAQIHSINIQESLDFEGNAIKNRIWYRGDSEELSQLYKQISSDSTRFWKAVPTIGMNIRKIHVGLPAIMVDLLSNIVIADLNEITLSQRQEEWKAIEKENRFDKLVEDAVTQTLYLGDGAFKISFDSNLSQLPILEFYPGDKVDTKYDRGRIKEIIFKTVYGHSNKEYVLLETYGIGYIHYNLTRDGKEYDLISIAETEHLKDVTWVDKFMMAVPLKFYDSGKWEGRGKSIYDSKVDAFDSLDETWSQWMDALRANRTKEYIPEMLLPRNPNTGEILKPNSFDNRYIKTDAPMTEGVAHTIELKQGQIAHESYLSTYITALDLCLQGILSPSTLGIDTKKLDNAEAQREKEKATLYTRNKIVETLQEVIPILVTNTLKAYDTLLKKPIQEIEVDVPFGEYANPSFESQVETVGKAKTQGIMSVEASVDELYGGSKDETWKAEEVARLKAEQGIAEVEEPGLNLEGVEIQDQEGGLSETTKLNGAQIGSLMNVIKMVKEGNVTRNEAISIIVSTLGLSRENAESFIEEGIQNASKGNEPPIPNEPRRI